MTEKKFEVGQYWRRRDGKKAKIVFIRSEGIYPILHHVGDELYWTSLSGQYYIVHDDESKQTPADLIEPWTDAPKKVVKKFAPALYKSGSYLHISSCLYENLEQAKIFCGGQSGSFIRWPARENDFYEIEVTEE